MEIRQCRRLLLPFLPLLLISVYASLWWIAAADEFPRDGIVTELDDKSFDRAISAFHHILVHFHAPWCVHCKRLSPERPGSSLDLKLKWPQIGAIYKTENNWIKLPRCTNSAQLSVPIVVAKLNADKYTKLAAKYEIYGYPTLKLFIHGVPVEYTGPWNADLLVRFLKKFVAPDVSLLESDSAIHNFIEMAGSNFPMFIGFGLNECVILEVGRKYKRKAWFSVAKKFSDDMMVIYDFDKVPALVSLHPKYNEQSVFYGPFEGDFLEDFIRQHQLPLIVPINSETLQLINDDKRNILLTILDDESDKKSQNLIKILKSAANANRDLIFGYVGLKQWSDFVGAFDISKSSKLPKLLVWDGNAEYHIVVGSEHLDDDAQGSQICRFLEGYREGRTIQKKMGGPSLMGFISSLIGKRTLYVIVFIAAILMVVQNFSQSADTPQTRRIEDGADEASISLTESQRNYHPGDKED